MDDPLSAFSAPGASSNAAPPQHQEYQPVQQYPPPQQHQQYPPPQQQQQYPPPQQQQQYPPPQQQQQYPPPQQQQQQQYPQYQHQNPPPAPQQQHGTAAARSTFKHTYGNNGTAPAPAYAPGGYAQAPQPQQMPAAPYNTSPYGGQPEGQPPHMHQQPPQPAMQSPYGHPYQKPSMPETSPYQHRAPPPAAAPRPLTFTPRRPAYQCVTTHRMLDTNEPLQLSGFLTKQSEWLRDWRRRFFVLKGENLFFGKGEWDAPHGLIDLRTCTTVKSAEMRTGRPNSLEVSTADGTTYWMCAETEKEKDDWIGAIGRAIVRCSSTYQDDAEYDSGDDEEEGNGGDGDSVDSQNPYK